MSIARFIFFALSKVLNARNTYLVGSLACRSKPQPLKVNFDYVRYSTLGLCYEEIVAKKVKGNVAELGVYQGEFAKRLNLLFSDRKIYLFDTFEGFNNKDVSVEQKNAFSKGDQDFSNTSVELVMKKMTSPNNCIVKAGFFPETAVGVSDSFCFVSIDADLYEPIYQGLLFFYPKLEKGGYIFVHDFNNEGYKGAKQAVMKFCEEFGVAYVPVPDDYGTAIITK